MLEYQSQKLYQLKTLEYVVNHKALDLQRKIKRLF